MLKRLFSISKMLQTNKLVCVTEGPLQEDSTRVGYGFTYKY